MSARGVMGKVLKISDHLAKKERKKEKKKTLDKLSKFLQKADAFFSLAEAERKRRRDDDDSRK